MGHGTYEASYSSLVPQVFYYFGDQPPVLLLKSLLFCTSLIIQVFGNDECDLETLWPELWHLLGLLLIARTTGVLLLLRRQRAKPSLDPHNKRSRLGSNPKTDTKVVQIKPTPAKAPSTNIGVNVMKRLKSKQ